MTDVVDVGALPDDGTGDEWRNAFIAINLALAAAAQHADDNANPHGTTAAQVGAYTKAEADTKIQNFLLQVQAGVVSPAQLAAALTGVLVASSTTSITLVEGQSRSITLDSATRSGFNPGTFALITRTSTTANYAVIQPTAYDVTAGVLTFTVRTVVGDPGPFADWQVASLAGSTVAQYAMLAVGQSARDDAVSARNTAKDWATKTSGEVIPGLGFGAKKYALDASGFADAASASADRAATSDPNSYYSKTIVDGKFSDLRGGASASYDTLGELEAGLTANITATSNLATAAAATDAKANRALRVARLYTAATFP